MTPAQLVGRLLHEIVDPESLRRHRDAIRQVVPGFDKSKPAPPHNRVSHLMPKTTPTPTPETPRPLPSQENKQMKDDGYPCCATYSSDNIDALAKAFEGITGYDVRLSGRKVYFANEEDMKEVATHLYDQFELKPSGYFCDKT